MRQRQSLYGVRVLFDVTYSQRSIYIMTDLAIYKCKESNAEDAYEVKYKMFFFFFILPKMVGSNYSTRPIECCVFCPKKW